MSARHPDLGPAAAVAFVAVVVDQVTKALARSAVEPGQRIDLLFGIDIVRVGNEGIAFGLLDEAGALLIGVVAAAFIVLLGYFMLTSDRDGLWLPIGLLAGGAIGNLIDRVTAGAVTDFIDPPNWPAFNVADVEITAGVILLLLIHLFEPARPDPPAEAGS